MTVLLTGAAGSIGSVLSDLLPSLGWSVRPFDRVPVEGGVVGDVTSPTDLDAAMADVDAVVHLAGKATEAPWPVIRDANIEGTFQVFEAARRHDVRRIVYASSNHAAGFTPLEGAAESGGLPADTPPRPDTLYGVSKVFGEALARYYVDRYELQIACLRIGTFEPAPPDRRALSTWLSHGDCARLVDACLRAPELTYALVWGISANTRRTWSLDSAQALGYQPQDDAEAYLDTLPEDRAYPSDGLVGGGFTSTGFDIDEVAVRAE
jgi:uronate dehydrogenase